ncbi:MAG: hypothetical protein RMK29_21215 [Myxococcales bacterium]|nr:hypothetical protein [Myxococcota bacterium]MDW8284231.1 hypothetical protein [Myxococcales bacterium]
MATEDARGPDVSLAEALEDLLERMVAQQQERVLRQAQALCPRLCADDLLQPDDYPELAGNARWNYEDGVLAGLRAAQMAVRVELRRRMEPT